jgi:YesN/AraC family two-component response regulator
LARVLIIDDEAQIRDMLRQMLEREGLEVMEASDGKIGVRLFRQSPADLVITDIIMPDKEGLETIRELLKDYPDLKIIAMSGGGLIGPHHYLKIAKGFGAVSTFTKPIDRDELIKTVREILGVK